MNIVLVSLTTNLCVNAFKRPRDTAKAFTCHVSHVYVSLTFTSNVHWAALTAFGSSIEARRGALFTCRSKAFSAAFPRKSTAGS